MQTLSKAWLFCVLLLISSVASANLTIEITRGSDQALPIGVVPFEGGEGFPEDVAQIVQDDLERSGMFAPLERSAMFERPSQASDVEFGTWRSLDTRYLVVGRAQQTGGGYQLQFDLMDISGQTRMIGETVNVSGNDLRGAAHYISDQVFEAITDIRGAFSTKIAYVTAQGLGDNMQFGLYVADADGARSQQVLTSDQPIMSPAWSPDGRKLAYVSFETERPAIYIQDVSSGQRVQATSFEGINGAPAWSPDGRRLAMSLSKDGQPDIYVLDIGSRSLNRLTDSNSIDTEPAFSPNGANILFTSDRSGGPQIYQMSANGGNANRVTYTGNYNARGRYSPEGDQIFLVHRSDRGYQVARQELDGGRLVVLSESTRDESPSVAPNGTMVIFATQQGGSGFLSAVSADGRSSFRLPAAQGEVRDPAWSPFLN